MQDQDMRVLGCPRVAGRYSLLEQLGAGGMGVVYRARDEVTGRDVAFKQLLSSIAGSRRSTIEALFEREYHTLVRLKHPRIIEVYEYGVTEDGPYYTMELLDGKDLGALAPLPYREACGHLRDVASSLALLHAHRLLHRDVSPRNVRLTRDGRAKLIDFGALAVFGQSAQIVGTPVCVAPEAMSQLPLDQRTDLFALGAIAYLSLTGRHAYPAKRMQDLPLSWQTSPLPPSKFVANIPPALDRLVLSLLSLDPLARPANAASVIDQLTAIGGLSPEEQEYAGDSYLLSGRMVGRQSEMQWLERRISRALAGRGAEVLIEGPSGIGKTRLLNEIGLEAQIKGMVVLKADAQAAPQPFGVATVLGMELLKSVDAARSAAEPHAPLLAHLSPLLSESLGHPELAVLSQDAGERRARFQTALHEWFVTAARNRSLFIAVDNVHAADDNSVAFVAALGRKAHQSGLIVLATQRAGDEVVATTSLKDFRQRSGHLKLGGLSSAACEDLVCSVFGDVANTGRVAQLLYERSAGNPQICVDLAQHLVRRQIAKYIAGTWVLPLDVSPDELPSHTEGVLSARLDALSTGARELAEALSIHRKPVSLEQCLSLARESDTPTYAALDELVAEQILVADGGSYRFAQQALREAILRHAGVEARRRHHLRAAETLLASAGSDLALQVEAGRHLLDAGEERRGADMLATAGRVFVLGGGGQEAPEHLAQAFEQTLAVYDRQDRSEHEKAAVLFSLIGSAFHTDWQLMLKHAERAILLGLRVTGLGLAAKLRRFLGRRIALIVALVVAAVRFGRAKRRGLQWDLREAIAAFCGIVPAGVGTHNICYNVDTVERLTETATPLTMFGEDHVAGLMHEFCIAQLRMGQSRELEARVILERLVDKYQDPEILEVVGESHYKAILGGILFSLGILYAYRVGDSALEVARKLDDLNVRVYAMAADQVRLLHHALRGESEEVQRYLNRVELFAVQGSTTWQAENFWPVLLLTGNVLAGDAIATRRISEQLARRAKELPSLAVYADAANAAYLTLRGDVKEAISVYESILPKLGIRRRVAWASVRAFYGDALNLAGDHARAKEVLEEVLSTMLPGEDEVVSRFLEVQRQLALAEAGLGNHARAAEILDGLLDRWGAQDQPLLVGLLHKARAEVSLLMDDSEGFAAHLAQMKRHFKATRNPALIAQWERLNEKGMYHHGSSTMLVGPQESESTGSSHTIIDRRLSQISAAPDPWEYALKFILERTEAVAGYLYALKGDGIRLVCASGPHEPPRAVETELAEAMKRMDFATRSNVDSDTEAIPEQSGIADRTVTAFFDSSPPPPPERPHQLLLLSALRGSSRRLAAGVILERGPHFVPIQLEYSDAIARVLCERE